MATITMTRAQYDALLAAALVADPTVKTLGKTIDKANGITRYILQIRWQDMGGTPLRRIELGKPWPEELTYKLELERPIARADVNTVLATQASNPVEVWVTPDPDGLVGWTEIDSYSFSSGA